jgi:feruloyl esterase
MLVYLPDHLPAGAPLVVALHGCNQTAGSIRCGCRLVGAGRALRICAAPARTADVQQRQWLLQLVPAGDARRGRGEAGSIRNMVERLVVDKELDRERIFIAGFSAGGAMTSVLLATDPEIFAAGAIIAGLPFGGATNVRHAFDSMVQGKSRPGREWAYFVRRASTHKGPWPRLSVWHGSADSTVQPMNAGEIIKQWTEVHGLTLYPTEASTSRGRQHRVWLGPDGAPLLESHSIPGMGHAVPVASGDTARFYGGTGPFAARCRNFVQLRDCAILGPD